MVDYCHAYGANRCMYKNSFVEFKFKKALVRKM